MTETFSDTNFSFCMLLLNADLTKDGRVERSLFSTINSEWCVYTKEAVALLSTTLLIFIKKGSSRQTLQLQACSSKQSALKSLQTMVDCHLLHSPTARPYKDIKSMALLQPTPKGLYVLQQFCRMHSYHKHNITALLCSSYNSMTCVNLPRSIFNRTLAVSPTLLQVLMRRILGPWPNLHGLRNNPTPVYPPSLPKIFGPNSTAITHMYARSVSGHENGYMVDISPYHNDIFTRPDSTAVCQYYTSTIGISMFPSSSKTPIVTRRAIFQWLMDCTNVEDSSEANMLLDLLVDHEYLLPIKSESRNIKYKLSDEAMNVCAWQDCLDEIPITLGFPMNATSPQRDDSNPPCLVRHQGGSHCRDVFSGADQFRQRTLVLTDESKISITLDKIMIDPGLLLVFDEFLREAYCEENLTFYKDLLLISIMYENVQQAEKKISSVSTSLPDAFKSYLLFVVEHVRCTLENYVGPRAPYRLNLDHVLNQKLELVLKMTSIPAANPWESVRIIEPIVEEAKIKVKHTLKFDSLPKFCAVAKNEQFIVDCIRKQPL